MRYLSVYTYELQSKLLKGGYIGDYIGEVMRIIKGDTWSSGYGSYVDHPSFRDGRVWLWQASRARPRLGSALPSKQQSC